MALVLSITVNIFLFRRGWGICAFLLALGCFAPSPRPSLILFLWFPKLLLDTVKFRTGDRSCSASTSSLVDAACLSLGLWQFTTPLTLAPALIGYCTCQRPLIGRLVQLLVVHSPFCDCSGKKTYSFLYPCLSICGGKTCFAEEKWSLSLDCTIVKADS